MVVFGKRRVLKLAALLLAISLLEGATCLFAYPPLHASVVLNYEITKGYAPGYDLTLFYNQSYGLRMSVIPNVVFKKRAEIYAKNGSLSTFRIEGDFESPMLLRTIDYRSYQGKKTTPFDFLTAYVGFGFNEMKARLEQQSFIARSDMFVESDAEHEVGVSVYSFAFGFYGAEKFITLDTRLLYLRGESDIEDVLDEETSFDHWLIQFAVGIGF